MIKNINCTQELVSIIIPVYNVEMYIEECLESICNQTYNNLEILLINDGSKDKSGMICENYKKVDNRIKVIHHKNKGVSYTRNIGILNSNGSLLAFIDPDDIISHDYIETLVEISRIQSISMPVAHYTSDYNGFINRKSDLSLEIISSEYYFNHILNDKTIDSYLWNKLFIKDILIKNNIFFDEGLSIFEDMLFIAQYVKKVNCVIKSNKIIYYYRIRKNSAVNSLSTEKIKQKCNAIESIWRLTNKVDSRMYKMAEKTWIECSIDYIYHVIRYNPEQILKTIDLINAIKENKKYVKSISVKIKLKWYCINLFKLYNISIF